MPGRSNRAAPTVDYGRRDFRPPVGSPRRSTHSSVRPFCVRSPPSGPRPTVGMPACTIGLRMSLAVCSGLTCGGWPVTATIASATSAIERAVDRHFRARDADTQSSRAALADHGLHVLLDRGQVFARQERQRAFHDALCGDARMRSRAADIEVGDQEIGESAPAADDGASRRAARRRRSAVDGCPSGDRRDWSPDG